jgi:hypothetical protein
MNPRWHVVFIILAASGTRLPGQAFTFRDLAWLGGRLPQNPAPGFISPTNIPGIVADFDASVVASAPTAQNTFTDLVGGVVASAVSTVPTNYGIGIYFDANTVSYTSPPITTASNFTLEVIFRPTPTNQPSNLGSAPLASIIDNKPRLIYGSLAGNGLTISNGYIVGQWGNARSVSSAWFPTTNWIRPTWDLVDSAGTLYTNGVVCGLGVGQPTNNFPFNSIGSANPLIDLGGYIQAIRLWSTNLSAPQIASIYYWNQTNGATDVTNGLAARWKMDEGSGTTMVDSVGGYNGTFQPEPGGYPVWTNGWLTANNRYNNGALYFNSNYVFAASATNLMNNFTNGTITFWYKNSETTLSVYPSNTNGVYYDNILFSKDNFNGSGWSEFLEDYHQQVDLTWFLGDGVNYTEQAFAIPDDNTWHFVVNEVTTNYPLVWVDGEPVNNRNYAGYVLGGTLSGYASTNGISVGYDTEGDTYCGSNFLDDVCFYPTNRLNQKQIAQKFQFGPQ